MRSRLAATQKNAREAERRQLFALLNRLKPELAAHMAAPITLWPTDAALLVRAAERALKAREAQGAPATSAGFHLWISADYQLRQWQKPKGTLAEVAQAWGLSRQGLDKIIAMHRDQARVLLAELGDDAGMAALIDEFRNVFRALQAAAPT
jgi:hypothetical protein